MTRSLATNPNSERLLRQAFDYNLPSHLIAQEPLPQREQSRLLVRGADGSIEHRRFFEIEKILPTGSLLIMNDSRVIPARLRGLTAKGRRFELLLLEPVPDPSAEIWRALGKPMRHFKVGEVLDLGAGIQVTITQLPAPSSDGPQPLQLRFECSRSALLDWLEVNGQIPLPPYIPRPEGQNAAHSADRERYQTVYAGAQRGSVAAPTAGLHFSPELLQGLQERGIELQYVTLHVGGGTFLPVKAEDPALHKMHCERYSIPGATVDAIHRAQSEGRPIVVVGTTSMRCLEAFYQGAHAPDTWQETDIFIRPETPTSRFRPQVASAIITNFHQPASTLVMLVAALIGYEGWQKTYADAVAAEYRFLSYGDSCLFWLR